MPPPQGTTKRTARESTDPDGEIRRAVRVAARQARRAAAAAGARRAHRSRRPPLPRPQLSSRQRRRTPGYGKTTVLAQWAAHDRREFAWVSLDHRDNDPVVFLTYVAEALNADSTVDPAVFKALAGSGDSLWARGRPAPRLGAGCSDRAARPGPRRRARAREPRLPRRPCRSAPPRAARVAAGALRPC